MGGLGAGFVLKAKRGYTKVWEAATQELYASSDADSYAGCSWRGMGQYLHSKPMPVLVSIQSGEILAPDVQPNEGHCSMEGRRTGVTRNMGKAVATRSGDRAETVRVVLGKMKNRGVLGNLHRVTPCIS